LTRLTRPTRARSVVPVALAFAALLAACAAAPKSAVAPAGSAAPPPPEAPMQSESDLDARRDPRAAMGRAKGDLDRAERELLASAGDCASACRALASMDRATGHLCALVGSEDDRARCEEAKTKVLTARERVRSTCGVCEGGPSLDRSAPIPSVRP